MPLYNSASVGSSVETSEITDGAVTTDKIADGAVTGDKLSGGVSVYDSGTITLDTDTTTFGTDLATIAISASDFGANDMLEIHLYGTRNNQDINIKARVTGTSNDGEFDALDDEVLVNNAGEYYATLRVFQRPGANDQLCCYLNSADVNGVTVAKLGTVDTNDTNILTTAFNIILDLRNVAGTAGTTAHRYLVYKIGSS